MQTLKFAVKPVSVFKQNLKPLWDKGLKSMLYFSPARIDIPVPLVVLSYFEKNNVFVVSVFSITIEDTPLTVLPAIVAGTSITLTLEEVGD